MPFKKKKSLVQSEDSLWPNFLISLSMIALIDTDTIIKSTFPQSWE